MASSKQSPKDSLPSLNRSTRICIKNVPLSFTENQLREHVQKCTSMSLTLTDCKILKTKTGKNRRMAFVGFKTHEMASHAAQYFDNSYALTSKLSVQLAFTKKEAPTIESLRPWSRHSTHRKLLSQGEKKTNNRIESPENHIVSADDMKNNQTDSTRQKMEYLSSTSTKTRSKFWTNDDVDYCIEKDEKTLKKDTETVDSSSTSSKSVISSTLEISKSEIQHKSINQDSNSKNETMSSDLDFLRSKIVKNFDDDYDDNNEDEEEVDSHDEVEDYEEEEEDDDDSSSLPSNSSSSSNISSSSEEDHDQVDSMHPLESTTIETKTDWTKSSTTQQEVSSTRLFIRNLPFSANEDELTEAFQSYGSIVECIIPLDNTHRNFGYGFIQFATPESASKALDEMDGSDFQGRLLHVLPARVRQVVEDTHVKRSVQTGGTIYKDEQEKTRQSNAMNNAVGWSTSFIRGDAVVDNLADRLGVSKGDVLAVKDGLSAGEAAIRLALGETRILEENREFFKAHGIDMDLIYSKRTQATDNSNDIIRRSSTIILVKNLPYDTNLEEITKTFHLPIGAQPKQVLMPPTKTLALVVYEQSYIAKKAFKTLAYKRFKNVPLYLEWAPLLTSTTEGDPTKEHVDSKSSQLNEISTQLKSVEMDEDPVVGASYTLFVKNLNFSTTEADLKELFEGAVDKVRAVRIPMKSLATRKKMMTTSAPLQETQHLSMGYGFVEFPSSEEAMKAMKSLQGHMLHGHVLEIKVSSSGDSGVIPASEKIQKSAKSKKLMIRNVPFEASRGELLQLFGSFGQLKSIRLPKKFDGGHRGFAFVEFVSSDEARAAMESLLGTHLYGRHLVVEYADDKDDVDTLRQKAQQQHDTITKAKIETSRSKKRSKDS